MPRTSAPAAPYRSGEPPVVIGDLADIVPDDASHTDAATALLAAARDAFGEYQAATLTMSDNPQLGTDPRRTADLALRVARLYGAWADRVTAALTSGSRR